MDLMNYDRGVSCESKQAIYHNPSLTDRLANQKAELERQLEKVNSALAALKKNPELQDLIDTIARV